MHLGHVLIYEWLEIDTFFSFSKIRLTPGKKVFESPTCNIAANHAHREVEMASK